MCRVTRCFSRAREHRHRVWGLVMKTFTLKTCWTYSVIMQQIQSSRRNPVKDLEKVQVTFTKLHDFARKSFVTAQWVNTKHMCGSVD